MELNEITVTALSSGNKSTDMSMQNLKQKDRPRVSTMCKMVFVLLHEQQTSIYFLLQRLVNERADYLILKLAAAHGHLLTTSDRMEVRFEKCPLCSKNIRFFFINFYEKIQMCENIKCDYPFGHVPLKIITEENGIHTVEVKSMHSKRSTCSNTTSFVSTAGWADVEKLCNLLESTEEITGVDLDQVPNSVLKKTEEEEKRDEIKRNVEKIKEMTKSMNDLQKEEKGVIKNEKWLKNLSYLQGLSGVNLVKPEERKKIRKKVHLLGTGELKIDIDKKNSSSIKIQINHPTGSNVRLV